MKIGDKVIAIQNRSHFIIKNNVYTILNIGDDEITISVEPNNIFTDCNFKLIYDKEYDFFYMFNDYFNLLKIQRKEKLKLLKTKINENRRHNNLYQH